MTATQVSRTGEFCRCPPGVFDMYADVDPDLNRIRVLCRTCGGSGDRSGGTPAVREVHVYKGHPDVVEVIHEDGNVFTITSAQLFNYRAWKHYRQWYWEQYKVVHEVAGQKDWDRMVSDWGFMSTVVAVEDEDPELVAAQGIITKLQSRKPKNVLDHLLSFAEFSIPTVRTTWELDDEEKEVVMVMSENISKACADRLSVEKFSHICRKSKWTVHPSKQIRLKGRRFRVWFFDPEILFPEDHGALEDDFTYMAEEADRMLSQHSRQTSLDQAAAPAEPTEEPVNGDLRSEAHKARREESAAALEKAKKALRHVPHEAGGNGKQPPRVPGNGNGSAPLVKMPERDDLAWVDELMQRPPKPVGKADLLAIHDYIKKVQDDFGLAGPSTADIAEHSGYFGKKLDEILNTLFEEGRIYQHRKDHWRAI